MRHLEEVTGRIAGPGAVTTGVVYSTPLARRPVGAGAAGVAGRSGRPRRRT